MGGRYNIKKYNLLLTGGSIVSFGFLGLYGKYKDIYYEIDDIEIKYDAEYKKYRFKSGKSWSKYNLKYINYNKYKIKKVLKHLLCCKLIKKG